MAMKIGSQMKLLCRGLLLATFAASLTLQAAEPGNTVLVIYNKRMPESKGVADHYAKRRDVPSKQVIGFDLPVTETMTRKEFIDRIQQPLLKVLQDSKLWKMLPAGKEKKASEGNPATSRVAESKIRYVALCYGVPTRILPDAGWVEKDAEKLGAELRRNEASVDSELACLPMPDPIAVVGPLPNPGYGATNWWDLHPTNGILLVSRLDGPSPAIARGLVDKAIQAEADGLWGRAYFDARGLKEGPMYLGDNWIRAGAAFARQMGFETVLDDKPENFAAGFPMSRIALYAGWYAADVSGPFTRPTVEFAPGAFAYHLHSFNAANVRSADRNWVGPLLAKGATITLGSVDEPYLAATPDVALFLSRLIYFQFSFGESAWAAQNSLSWQNIAVGDPLYRPYWRSVKAVHEDLEKRQSKLLEWSYLRWMNFNMAGNTNADEGIVFLENLPAAKKSSVLLEKLADLYWTKKKLTDSLDTYELALKQEVSPQQKLRIVLNLAQRRAQLGPDSAALGWYQQLLKDNPDYPDALQIYQQMLPVAQRAENKGLIEKCQQEIKRLTPPPAVSK